jgi:hypothetical protein
MRLCTGKLANTVLSKRVLASAGLCLSAEIGLLLCLKIYRREHAGMLGEARAEAVLWITSLICSIVLLEILHSLRQLPHVSNNQAYAPGVLLCRPSSAPRQLSYHLMPLCQPVEVQLAPQVSLSPKKD